ncbi:hypothetical protein RDI58_001079 [Solanum bulbocastanum]|uniref:Uncharacterized protein n=1 Tax=Solanum bulbocastanum TaxID=147425 RepID=A0AAN8YPM9_SOLBU
MLQKQEQQHQFFRNRWEKLKPMISLNHVNYKDEVRTHQGNQAIDTSLLPTMNQTKSIEGKYGNFFLKFPLEYYVETLYISLLYVCRIPCDTLLLAHVTVLMVSIKV